MIAVLDMARIVIIVWVQYGNDLRKPSQNGT